MLAHDQFGNLASIKHFDLLNKPTFHRDGYHEKRNKFDQMGNIIEVSFYDSNGERSYANGYHNVVNKYDPFGNIIEQKTLDHNGKLKDNSFGYALVQNEYHGMNKIGVKYFDQNQVSQLTLPQIKNTIDKKGRLIKKEFLDDKGNLTPGYKGSSIWTVKYNQDGTITERKYYGSDGYPHNNEDGYHSSRFKYNKVGTQTSVCYYDVQDKLTLIQSGYACLLGVYDIHNRLIEVQHLDHSHDILTNYNGCPNMRFTYDSNGYKSAYSCFGKGKPLTDSTYGVHKVRYKNDSLGNHVVIEYFDIHGNPVLKSKSHARVNLKYNSAGQKIVEEYFGINGEAILHRGGYYKSINHFDQYGHSAGYEFFGVNGKRINSTFSGSAFIEIKNRFDGKSTSVKHYDEQYQPVIAVQGYHARVMKYDPFGRETKRRFLNVNNQLMLNPQSNCAVITKEYIDSSDTLSRQECLDVNLKTR